MTPKQFDDTLLSKRAELTEAFKKGSVSEVDVATKAIMDYQEYIAKTIFSQLKSMEASLNRKLDNIEKKVKK